MEASFRAVRDQQRGPRVGRRAGLQGDVSRVIHLVRGVDPAAFTRRSLRGETGEDVCEAAAGADFGAARCEGAVAGARVGICGE